MNYDVIQSRTANLNSCDITIYLITVVRCLKNLSIDFKSNVDL